MEHGETSNGWDPEMGSYEGIVGEGYGRELVDRGGWEVVYVGRSP